MANKKNEIPSYTTPIGDGVIARYGKLLNTREASAYVGLHETTLRKFKHDDIKRAEAGEPIKGPPWLRIGASIYYQPKALDAWVDSKISHPPGIPPVT